MQFLGPKQMISGAQNTLAKMGNAVNGLYHKRVTRLHPEEQSGVNEAFDKMSGVGPGQSSKKTVSLEKFKAYIAGALPERMIIRLYNGIRSTDVDGNSSAKSEQISKDQLAVFISHLFKGNVDEKGSGILGIISVKENSQVNGVQVQEFTEDLIHALFQVLQFRNLLNGWVLKGSLDSGIKVLVTQLLSELKPAGKHGHSGHHLADSTWDKHAIGNWVQHAPLVSTFLLIVISQGMSIMQSHAQETLLNYIPKCKGWKRVPCETVLDLPSVLYINSKLPSEVKHRWRLLFSTLVNGESFSQLISHIVKQGPTVLVIKDSGGNIFGGFASKAWEVKPQFQGDHKCFLFSLLPDMAVYTNTGYNQHYMYLNSGQQTMPNGLGMGGQHDYFGLWIDSAFGKGHSKAKPRSTTYNSPQLSSSEDFTIDVLEVWGLGDRPTTQGLKEKDSIFDTDPEAVRLLELAGKNLHSRGLRHVERDDEEH